MKAFGLTGNMGCGKSTIAHLLSKFSDIVVLDCDSLAKEIVSDRRFRSRISRILGVPLSLKEKIDPKSIAEIIFKDPTKKKMLEDFIHSLVWKIVQKRVDAVDETKICIVESALIYEKKMEEKFIAIIVAVCGKREQFRRLHRNRKMKTVAIENRLLHQLPQREKKRRARYVLKTDCSRRELQKRVKRLYQALKKQKGNLK